MSAKIWNDIQAAIKEQKPSLFSEFELCRDRINICAFLDKHFPLSNMHSSANIPWETQLLSRVPEILKSRTWD